MTDELLKSKLNGRSLATIQQLDLSNCKLRDFEDMFNSIQTPQLKELNLNNNNMTSLKCIGTLQSLKILRCRNNRLDTLHVKQPQNEKRGLFGVQSIEVLDVSNNNLQYLYGLQVIQLKELKILLVSEN